MHWWCLITTRPDQLWLAQWCTVTFPSQPLWAQALLSSISNQIEWMNMSFHPQELTGADCAPNWSLFADRQTLIFLVQSDDTEDLAAFSLPISVQTMSSSCIRWWVQVRPVLWTFMDHSHQVSRWPSLLKLQNLQYKILLQYLIPGRFFYIYSILLPRITRGSHDSLLHHKDKEVEEVVPWSWTMPQRSIIK